MKPNHGTAAMVGVCLCVLCACNPGPTSPSVEIDETFVLSPGEQVHLADTALTIRFAAVIGDSRCPVDVVCVSAGDAVVRLEIRDGSNRPTVHELHTADPTGTALDDLIITVLRLTPFPVSSRRIEQEEYRATLRATRLAMRGRGRGRSPAAAGS